MRRRVLVLTIGLASLVGLSAVGLELKVSRGAADQVRISELNDSEAKKLADELWREKLEVDESEPFEFEQTSESLPADPRSMGALEVQPHAPASDAPGQASDLSSLAPFRVVDHWPDPPEVLSRAALSPRRSTPRFSLRPLLFVAFNRPVRGREMIDSAFIWNAPNYVDVRRVRVEDVPGDHPIRELVEEHGPKRSFVFTPRKALEPGITYEFGIKGGASAAAGSGELATRHSYEFGTVESLGLSRTGCRKEDPCAPGDNIRLRFNNLIDPEHFRTSHVRLPRTLKGAVLRLRSGREYGLHNGGVLSVSGDFQPDTTYQIGLSEHIRDVNGQTLGERVNVEAHFGPRSPSLEGTPGSFAILRPTEELEFRTTNIQKMRLKVARVEHDQFTQYLNWRGGGPGRYVLEPPFERSRRERRLAGKSVIINRVNEVSADPSGVVETKLDPASWSADPDASYVVDLRVVDYGAGLERPHLSRSGFVTWVEVSELGIDVQHAQKDMQIWVTDLSTGLAVEGARVKAMPAGDEAKTDNEGTATISNDVGKRRDRERAVAVEHDGDSVLLPFDLPDDNTSAGPSVGRTHERAYSPVYLMPDRAVYRPGDVVSVAGIARAFDPFEEPRVSLLSNDEDVKMTARQGRRLLASGTETASEHGMFAFDFELPDDVSPGQISIDVELPDGTHSGVRVHVGTPVEPYWVQSLDAEAGAILVDDTWTLIARFWQLAGLAGHPVSARWEMDTKRGSFEPPHWAPFEFGNRWIDSEYEATDSRSGTFTTPPQGAHSVSVTAGEDEPAAPRELRLKTQVTDGAGLELSEEVARDVLQADAFVGLHVPGRRLVPRDSFEVQAIAVNAVGLPLDGARVDVIAERVVWAFDNWTWHRKTVSRSRCRFRAAGAPHTCRFDAEKSGAYRITALVRDARNRLSETVIPVHVEGKPTSVRRRPDLPQLRIVPDKARYQVGDTAKLTIRSPLEKGHGLVSYQQGGRPISQHFEIENGQHMLEFEVTEEHVEDVLLELQVVSAETPDTPWPAMAGGRIRLDVARERLSLEVDVEPGAPDKPTLLVDVHDSDEEAVSGADVLVFVARRPTTEVGEYELGNPVGLLVPRRKTRVGWTHSREWRPPPVDEHAGEIVAPRGKSIRLSPFDRWPPDVSARRVCCGRPSGPYIPRDDSVEMPAGWKPFSTILPLSKTDPSGRARLELPIDARAGEYRVFAIAAASATELGTAHKTVSSAALIPSAPAVRVEPDFPERLVVGKPGEVSVLVENVADAPRTIDLAMRTVGVEARGAAAKRVVLPASSSSRILFEVLADSPGRGTIEVGWKAMRHTGSGRAEVVISPESMPERVVRKGEIDDALQWDAEIPDHMDAQVGGLGVMVSNSPILHLFDAFEHVSTAAHSGANVDELSSRILANLRLLEVRDVFPEDSLPSEESLRTSIGADVYRLEQVLEPSKRSHQGVPGSLFDVDKLYRVDGWPRTQGLWPFMRVRVAHALIRAKQAGFRTSRKAYSSAVGELYQTLETAVVMKDKKVARSLRAYGYYVASVSGNTVTRKRAKELASMNPETSLTPDAAAWLVLALADEPGAADVRTGLVRYLVGSLTHENGERHMPRRTERRYAIFESDARTEALILNALAAHGVGESVEESVMRGLVERTVDGRWQSPQQNQWAIDAVVRHARAYSPASGLNGARLWLDGELGHRLLVKGDVPDSDAFTVQAKDLARFAGEDRQVPVMLESTHSGRLYYRIALELAAWQDGGE